MAAGRVRRAAAAARPRRSAQPGLREALCSWSPSATRGDPQAALLWVSSSQRHLAGALAEYGFRVSHKLVGRLLGAWASACKPTARPRRSQPPGPRRAVPAHQRPGERFPRPASRPSRSTPRRRSWSATSRMPAANGAPRAEPEPVRVHDFIIPEMGKAVPYGVYDIAANLGWVNVGIDHDTAAFAVESIRRWWKRLGRQRYPDAKRLLITADCGGSNGARVRLWKLELQSLADQPGLAITVSIFRPAPANGTASSTACSPSSARTGAASRCCPTRSSSS